MTPERLKKVSEILGKQDLYISLLKKDGCGPAEIKTVEELFSRLKLQTNQMIRDAVVTTLTADSYERSLAQKKIDPYIAGGIGHGLAGTAGGIFMGASAMESNAKIDLNRAESKARFDASSNDLKDSSRSASHTFFDLEWILRKYPSTKKLWDRDEEIESVKAEIGALEKQIEDCTQKRDELTDQLNNSKSGRKVFILFTPLFVVCAILCFFQEMIWISILCIFAIVLFLFLASCFSKQILPIESAIDQSEKELKKLELKLEEPRKKLSDLEKDPT